MPRMEKAQKTVAFVLKSGCVQWSGGVWVVDGQGTQISCRGFEGRAASTAATSKSPDA